MTPTPEARERVGAEALSRVLQDWRYKAGVETGRGLRGAELRLRESERDLALIALYKADPVACAELCDGTLDRRGGLLGKVRQWVQDEAKREAAA